MIGVDYDLFWNLNPKSLKPFVKAFDLRESYDNMRSWRDGLYIRMAVASLLDKKSTYPKRPLDMNGVEGKVSPAEEIRNKMLLRMKILNSRFRKGGSDE